MLEFFDLDHTAAKNYLLSREKLWFFATDLKDFLWRLGRELDGGFCQISRGVWVHKSAEVAPSAYIAAPTVIFDGAGIRHNACIRGGALIGRGCVVGNCSEVKNSILFDEAKIPHFNYVGDSILGYRAHFGAGVKASNVKDSGGEIFIETPRGRVGTGLKKLGAFAGDCCEVGCNAVLAPAAVIGSRGRVYPLCFARGYLPPDSILKTNGTIEKIR